MGAANPSHAGHRRRPQWRGERKAILVRMPVEVADRLTRAAKQQRQSVSEHAAGLLAVALAGPESAEAS